MGNMQHGLAHSPRYRLVSHTWTPVLGAVGKQPQTFLVHFPGAGQPSIRQISAQSPATIQAPPPSMQGALTR